MTLTPRESLRGRYVPLVHYRQPEHDSFPVHVRVAAGREWRGESVGGCGGLFLLRALVCFQLQPR